MFLVTLLYLVSIFLEDIFAIFGHFSGISSEIALRHSTFRRNSGKITKNHKNALHTRDVANLHGRARPLADALGGSARARGAWTRQYPRVLLWNVCFLGNFPELSVLLTGIYFHVPRRSSNEGPPQLIELVVDVWRRQLVICC